MAYTGVITIMWMRNLLGRNVYEAFQLAVLMPSIWRHSWARKARCDIQKWSHVSSKLSVKSGKSEANQHCAEEKLHRDYWSIREISLNIVIYLKSWVGLDACDALDSALDAAGAFRNIFWSTAGRQKRLAGS